MAGPVACRHARRPALPRVTRHRSISGRAGSQGLDASDARCGDVRGGLTAPGCPPGAGVASVRGGDVTAPTQRSPGSGQDRASTRPRFGILGPLQAVADDGRRVDIGGPKQRDLLAMLLVQLNQFVPASRLIDELWDGAPPASADVTLRTHVSRLRQRLAAVGSERALVTRPSGYGLVLDPELVDSYRFERLAGLGQEALGLGKPERAEQLLRAALELWRGEVLEDLGSPGYAQSEATRLDELRLVTLESRMDADLARPAPRNHRSGPVAQHDHPPPRSSPGSRNTSFLLRPEQRAPDSAGVKDPRPLRGRP